MCRATTSGSISWAWASTYSWLRAGYAQASRDYVLRHAQEMRPDVVRQHIDLYVNEFTENLGAEGHGAVNALLGRAAAAGLTPPVRALA